MERIRSIPLSLGLILIAGALMTCAWDISVPPFQGPDEDYHFAYLQHLAETGHAPSAVAGNGVQSIEQQDVLSAFNLEALRGDATGRPAWSAEDLARWRAVAKILPKGGRSDGEGPNPQARNPPLYYAIMAIPYRLLVWLPLPKRLFLLRLISGLSFLATIALMWLIAGEVLGPVRWKRVLATGVVALEPQLSFMSAIINTDSLLIALTTGFLLAALRLVKRGPSTGRVLAAAGLSAAAILTHGRGIATVPVLALAIVVAWVRYRPSRREAATQGALAAGVGAAALAGYYLFSRSSGSGSLYDGDVTALNSGAFNLRQFLSSIYQFYLPRLSTLKPRLGPSYGYRQVFIETFYGAFGWLEVTFKPGIYDALQVASALGLIGLYTACVARWRRLRQEWPMVVVMLSLLLSTLLLLHYVSYRSLLLGSDPLIVGRYLLPMISLFGLPIAFTVGSLPRRLGPPVAAVILSAGVLLSLAGVGMTMARFYA